MDAKITLQKMSTPDTSGQRDNIYWRHVSALRFVMTTEDSLSGFWRGFSCFDHRTEGWVVVSYEPIDFFSGGNRYLIGSAGQFDSWMAGQRSELLGATERRLRLAGEVCPDAEHIDLVPFVQRDRRVDSSISLLTPPSMKT